MRILITGGDGFIGKHLVRRLSHLANEILVIDNHVTSYYENMELPNVNHMESSIENVALDLIPKVDIIYHLASVASPLVYKKLYESVYYPNVQGTELMIKLAQRDGAIMYYFSTSEVYGMAQKSNHGIKEDDSFIVRGLSQRSVYANAKRMGEEIVYRSVMQHGTKAYIYRLFNVYGNNMDLKNVGYGRVIPNFVHAVKNNTPLTIFGDGQQVRSFLWIDDLMDVLMILQSKEQIPLVLNIGNDESHTIEQLAHYIINESGVSLNINYTNRDFDDPLWRKPNCSLLYQVTGWKPKMNLFQGIKHILQNY